MSESAQKYAIGWFSTGRGANSQALLKAAVEATESGHIPARIAFVFCNRERDEHEGSDAFMDLVESLGIPLVSFSFRDFRRAYRQNHDDSSDAWRADYDRESLRRIEPFGADVIALAGYMLIFSKDGGLNKRYPALNLHPALPGGPIGTWQEVIWQLIDQRAEYSGVMIHLATDDLDEGPAVSFCTFSIDGLGFHGLWRQVGSRKSDEIRTQEGENNALFLAIRTEQVKRESLLFIATLRSFAQGDIRVKGSRILTSAGEVVRGYDLTVDINREIASAAEHAE